MFSNNVLRKIYILPAINQEDFDSAHDELLHGNDKVVKATTTLNTIKQLTLSSSTMKRTLLTVRKLKQPLKSWTGGKAQVTR